MSNADKIAAIYAEKLKDCLTEIEINNRRSGETVANDHMDANMLMHDAWVEVMGYDLIPLDSEPSDTDIHLWNTAMYAGENIL